MSREPHLLKRASTTGAIPEGAVFIGWPSKWHNQFRFMGLTREEAVRRHREWFLAPEQAALREEAQRELMGCDLVCYCTPLPCHGTVLLEVANGRVH